MPAKQPLLGERRLKVLGGVEHHLDHAFDISVGRRECADVHAEPPRDRGSDLFAVELFALDFARFQNFFGQGLQHGFGAELESEALHAPDEAALVMAYRREGCGECLMVPPKIRPMGEFVDIDRHAPHLMRRKWRIFSAKASPISAHSAEHVRRILRTLDRMSR